MDVKFIETSPELYEQEMIRAYEQITGRALYPADPERLLINLMTYGITLLTIAINETGKQNLLRYATGDKLDALAEFYGVQRLPAKPAITTLRFYIDQVLPFDVVIPQGTRATPDGNLFFATTQEARITAGQTYVDVQAECETPGTIGNGFAPGQINKLVDVLPYVSRVENITMSLYGVEEEDDERFRERIRISIERFSNAGSREAYIFHTKTAHQDIEDVEVFSPSPGVVKVLFLMKGGQIPTQDMISLVQSYLSDEKVRPLTDQVFVEAPTIINYSVNLTYYIHRKDEARVSEISARVYQAVQDFIDWTGKKIGRDILPEELIARVKEAGAYRVVVNSPAYTPIARDQVAKGVIETITYGGFVDD